MSPTAQAIAPAHPAIALALGSLPVLILLAFFVLLDSYKLVRPRSVAILVLAGSCAACVSLAVNLIMRQEIGLSLVMVARYIAPLLEEAFKGAFIVFLLRTRRVAFLVDAAISGFAVGAGFAAVENVVYFVFLPGQTLTLWMVRGFGTAVMHGTVTAIMAVTAQHLSERHGSAARWVFIPGWALATFLHSSFNHFFLAPDLSAVFLLVALPLLFLLLFQLSGRSTRAWLGTGFDTDAELLGLIHSGSVSDSRVGKYLGTLKASFSPAVVADMLCLLRLKLELSIRAKGMLLMRQTGFEVPTDPEVGERFAELAYLEKSIGPTGLLALSPMLHMSDRDLWQLNMLRGKT
jgi:RsiW-degrading membrane proteinase PrsW (M82 family)